MGATLTLPPAVGWRRLRIADRLSTTDPSSRISVAYADTATGISRTVTGGWSTTDPLDGGVNYWRALDPVGRPLDPALCWDIDFLIIERTPAGLSSDLVVMVGLLNEATDSATVDGIYCAIRYSGAGRNVRHGAVFNGAGANLLDDASDQATLRIVSMSMGRMGASHGESLRAQGLTSTGAIIAAAATGPVATSGAGTGWMSAGVPTIFFGDIRSATTAGAEAVVHDVYYRATAQSALVV